VIMIINVAYSTSTYTYISLLYLTESNERVANVLGTCNADA